MYCLLYRVEGNIVYSQVSIFIVLSILVRVQVCFLYCFYINKLHYVYSLTFKVHSQGLFIICHHVYSSIPTLRTGLQKLVHLSHK